MGGRCAEAAAEPHGNGAPAAACAPGARAQPGDSASSPLRRRRRAGGSGSGSGAAGPEPLRGATEHQAPAAGVRRGRRRGAVAGAEHAGAERGGAGTGKSRAGGAGPRPRGWAGVRREPPAASAEGVCTAGGWTALGAERCSARPRLGFPQELGERQSCARAPELVKMVPVPINAQARAAAGPGRTQPVPAAVGAPEMKVAVPLRQRGSERCGFWLERGQGGLVFCGLGCDFKNRDCISEGECLKCYM